MISARVLSERLSGLGVRLLGAKGSRRRVSRAGRGLPVAAEISLLEPRCLMSVNVAPGGHHAAKVAQDANDGAPVLVKFDGYEWNTNYNWAKDTGTYVSNQLWSPDNAQSGADGLTLSITSSNGQSVASDAELWSKGGERVHPGYGTYMVSAKVSSGTFADFAQSNPYAIFGAFTYQNIHGVGTVDGDRIKGLPKNVVENVKKGMSLDGTYTDYSSGTPKPGQQMFQLGTLVKKVEGDTVILNKDSIVSSESTHTIYFTPNEKPNGDHLFNRKREIDGIEVSKFGSNTANAQFAIQPTDPADGGIAKNVFGLNLADSGAITIKMVWSEKRVTWDLYYGSYSSLNELKKATPNLHAATSSKQDKFVPDPSQQTFHLNLWAFQNVANANPWPSPASVIVTKFQYEA